MVTLNEASALVKPILDEYHTEKSSIEKQITVQGTIPKYLCEKCPRNSILEIQKLSIGEYVVSDLIDWINENEVHGLNSTGKTVQFTSPIQKIGRIKGRPVIRELDGGTTNYIYKIPLAEFLNRPLYELFLQEFEYIDTCGHLDEKTIKTGLPTLLTKFSRLFSLRNGVRDAINKKRDKVLRFLCSECFGRIDAIGCEGGITKRSSLVFDHSCPIEQILLQRLLEKANINHKASQLEPWRHSRISLLLTDLNIIVTNEKNIDHYLDKFTPECILAFGSQKDLFNYIHLGVNVIIFDESNDVTRYFLFDKGRVVEDSLEKIIKAIVNKLDVYTEEERGNEHERLVKAFQRIGRNLGFITQQELPIKGTRVDAAWLDRKGIVQLAIEVETTSTWKKDIISTWEAKPQLSIILVHDKTNKGIRELTQYTLLENMPHKLLFINYSIKKAYLVEKQEIIKWFDLENKRESTESDMLEL